MCVAMAVMMVLILDDVGGKLAADSTLFLSFFTDTGELNRSPVLSRPCAAASIRHGRFL